jgi:hypothetical protein
MDSSKRKALIMPSGISSYYSPYWMPSTPAPHHPGLALRARVWAKHAELDAALAGGADPAQCEELALRAGQLAAPKKREELAQAITYVIDIAEQHSHTATATLHSPYRPKQVLANRSLLLESAGRMRGQRPVAIPGLALTALMLEDGRGPLTTSSDPVALERAVRAALSALDAVPQPQDAQRRIGTSA